MAKLKEVEASIVKVDRSSIAFRILGTSPLIYHRMAEKAKRELLFPQKLTKAEKTGNLKHNPIEEYRGTVYRNKGDKGPLLMVPSVMFKAAMMNAALDLPDITKASIGRMLWVEGDTVDVYGVPELFMNIVRMAGMTRAPDIRTRAILPRWCCTVKVSFVKNLISEQSVLNLMVAAGMTIGIGDFRQEKGKGSYGAFTAVNASDEDFKDIVKSGGYKQQEKGLESPAFYDYDSEELYNWFINELKSRKGNKEALSLVGAA